MALIALGVTGGIGAYKAVEVARGLQKRGHDVVAIMTRSARRFVGPVTFEAITRRRVITDQWAPGANADIGHVSVADDIDLLLVAPATANIIGKFAAGIADDFLSSLYLATRAPVVMAPAMNSNMLAHPAVVRNLETLAARGVRIVEPGEGYLACGWIGRGRLAEPEAIVDAAAAAVSASGSLAGRTLLVTAGPTYEDLDPVRFIGNRSSGRMGFAIAAEAKRMGAQVTLVSGPATAPRPAVDEVIEVRSAADMREVVVGRAPEADAVIMAAAVANFAPAVRASQKISEQSPRFVIELERTRDILMDLSEWRSRQGRERPLLIGFAAETHDVVERARAKRLRKGVDLIVANDVSRDDIGFEAEANAVTLIGDGPDETLPVQSKSAIARAILERVARMLSSQPVS
ncbi:MAG TPA: bifunctional phosphopantothenoylcysteine decarboxylase/phosphopantothenate--cysteine ligase CoaBC [Vicinamibacterales bacterium]|nr:bifunctional phosphopantothenoylcysteine decarboxylase/phosphopantothenate--cysteine ligase CoaBC [Vicinamibacterales bacterium]